jgi:hypothetical protein
MVSEGVLESTPSRLGLLDDLRRIAKAEEDCGLGRRRALSHGPSRDADRRTPPSSS